jgi:hypothetical protein
VADPNGFLLSLQGDGASNGSPKDADPVEVTASHGKPVRHLVTCIRINLAVGDPGEDRIRDDPALAQRTTLEICHRPYHGSEQSARHHNDPDGKVRLGWQHPVGDRTWVVHGFSSWEKMDKSAGRKA